MGGRDNGYLGGLWGFAKRKHEAKVEEKKPRRSHSEPPADTERRRRQGKLHKPPQAGIKPPLTGTEPERLRLERPRNRLRKSFISLTTILQPAPDLFVLEYEPYPHLVRPGKVLGIYSTFDAVTLGALKHGAYTFSREGLLDGSEYLSSTGRIKLVQTTVQRSGMKAMLPPRSRSLDGEPIRLDIPHPKFQVDESKEVPAMHEVVYLAARKGPTAASWIGVYEDKSLAWGACLKDKAMCAIADTLCDEERSIGIHNMPQISGRLVGSGRFTWMVEKHIIDRSEPEPIVLDQPTWRDV
ncbi:hypothetical protein HBI56_157950 [Parastagonospora nodorum]|uniref:Uncharacterized protein n=2 Tax=Phaeosphaeria nodorum (strain SN15 / ATCC MYA-4574 / FGSC 10173) TaxID=321614 RepID=A0A7U2HXG8_PHANO|nr:hypothetical protein SNOG_02406 [Parastagonospora nodorum SN15]KAH3907414.1 hypothetical protein HBH56_188690 [Parastagonospora nodorum]EAT90618.1 hypothetical protein SNOG_02406 [Parastagonospora nodorum SN15]KAH3925044.1 hypothetical protein HBH54_184500 [Parastagonospora nodorum]KAH3954209.1 hypothetical protein HBH53_023850 [Parastagonospora nodorum]KAH3963712.1 hypothetical protein HBH51_163680 [Parastagonospora nodorum]